MEKTQKHIFPMNGDLFVNGKIKHTLFATENVFFRHKMDSFLPGTTHPG